MEARVDFNIVDHYYYPDSDLETIQEESEDDRSTVCNSRRSSFNATPSAQLERSKNGIPSPFFVGTSKQNVPKSMLSAITNGFPSVPACESYSGFNKASNDRQGTIDGLSGQKIVYAKCLTNTGNHSAVQSPQLNGIHEQEEHVDASKDMFKAAERGDLQCLNTFSKDELNNSVDEKGNSALHVAAEHGHLHCVKKLVSHFPPQMVSLPNDDLSTAAALAIKNNHMHCVRWLVRHSVARDELTVSQRTSSIDGSTTRPPLAHVAARFDRDEILDWICEEMSREQVAVDCGDHCSNTPVHVAARYGHLRCIQILVARGASVTILNSDGDTPGQAAQRHGHDTTVGYLVVVETCVSLAQQLVAVRNEMEGLKSDNEKLKKHLKESSLAGGKAPYKETIDRKQDKQLHPTVRGNEGRRPVLQEQPPPSKVWEVLKKEERDREKQAEDSIESHPVSSLYDHSMSIQQENLQRKIDEALNSPSTAVDGKHNKSLRVSDVDLPPQKEELTASHSSVPEDVNDEVETITKGINGTTDRKPWEKLTMDEMLRRVRDMRYQASPSISHYTEDSTMESVEVMRERMAAASRWFLVEKGRGKPKQSVVVHHKTARHDNQEQPQAIPSRKQPWGPRYLSSKPSPSPMHDQPNHQQNQKKLQSAIQQYYQQSSNGDTAMGRQAMEKKNVPPHSEVNINTIDPVTKDTKASNKPPTGTLKFMVSHSKSAIKKTPPSSSSTSSQNTPANSKASIHPPSHSLPLTAPTQRNNSYRRAVQVNKEESAPFEKHSSCNTSSSGSSSGAEHNNKSSSTPLQLSVRPSSSDSNKPRYDPLQKRSMKDNSGPVWNKPQGSSTKQKTKTVTNTTSTKSREISSKHQTISKSNPSRSNQWTVPSSKPPYDQDTSLFYMDNGKHDEFELSEVPEIKVEIPSRQSSFLRRVQGKLR